MSPESPEPDGEYQLTPRTEAKYSKIDEEFQMMMQRNQMNGQRVRSRVTFGIDGNILMKFFHSRCRFQVPIIHYQLQFPSIQATTILFYSNQVHKWHIQA